METQLFLSCLTERLILSENYQSLAVEHPPMSNDNALSFKSQLVAMVPGGECTQVEHFISLLFSGTTGEVLKIYRLIAIEGVDNHCTTHWMGNKTSNKYEKFSCLGFTTIWMTENLHPNALRCYKERWGKKQVSALSISGNAEHHTIRQYCNSSGTLSCVIIRQMEMQRWRAGRALLQWFLFISQI